MRLDPLLTLGLISECNWKLYISVIAKDAEKILHHISQYLAPLAIINL